MHFIQPQNHRVISNIFIPDVEVSTWEEAEKEIDNAVCKIVLEQGITHSYIIGEPNFRLNGMHKSELQKHLEKGSETVLGELFVFIHHYTAIGFKAIHMDIEEVKKVLYSALFWTLDSQEKSTKTHVNFWDVMNTFGTYLNASYDFFVNEADKKLKD